MVKSFLATVALLLIASAALAVDGNDWREASEKNRLKEVTRILENIKQKGCFVKFSPQYYVRQLNDFYANRDTTLITLPQALALIATSVGENWNC